MSRIVEELQVIRAFNEGRARHGIGLYATMLATSFLDRGGVRRIVLNMTPYNNRTLKIRQNRILREAGAGNLDGVIHTVIDADLYANKAELLRLLEEQRSYPLNGGPVFSGGVPE